MNIVLILPACAIGEIGVVIAEIEVVCGVTDFGFHIVEEKGVPLVIHMSTCLLFIYLSLMWFDTV